MPIDANDSSGESGIVGGLAGFSTNFSIVRPLAPTPTMPNAFASCRATGIAATVTPGPVLQVLRDHLPRVHPVHVVGADDHHDVGCSSLIRFIDWKIASAEPLYQCGPSRCWAGTGVT